MKTFGRQQSNSRSVDACEAGEWLVAKSLKRWSRMPGFLLVDDGVAGSVDQDLRWHHASEGNGLRPEFERIRHGERVGMAGNRNQVFRRERRWSVRECGAAPRSA